MLEGHFEGRVLFKEKLIKPLPQLQGGELRDFCLMEGNTDCPKATFRALPEIQPFDREGRLGDTPV